MDPSHRCRLALDEFDRLLDSGRPIDQAALLDSYSDVADELAPQLDVIEQLVLLRPEPARDAGAALPPDQFFGDYELLELIGRGAMGVVYKARQRSLGRIVALKVHHAGPFASPEEIARLRQEASTQARLAHPRIVTVHEAGEVEGRTYITMQYVPGTNLAQQIKDHPPSIPQAAEIAHRIAEAIAYAHGRDVVHRDLKPANILIDDDGDIRIADFGLGKVLTRDDGLTQTGQILGTVRYLAPEQFQGAATAPRAGDIYSIGAILYELLCGRPPFWSQTQIELIRQIQEQEPTPLRQLDRGVPKDLETICLKCLSKSPGERYVTAADLAADLGCFVRGEPVRARPIGAWGRVLRQCRRRPRTTALVAVALLAIVAGSVASVLFAVAANRGQRDAYTAQQAAERSARDARDQQARAQAELARSEALVYAGQIDHAMYEWEGGDTLAARRALEATRPELRGWEYDYLATRFVDQQYTLTGHKRHVMSVAFSPDSRLLASGSWDATIKVWDVSTRTEIWTLTGHAAHVESVDFSPDGRRIVSGSRDNTIKVWDVETGSELLSWPAHAGFVMGVKFSPDGRRIISGGRDNIVRVWDARTGHEIRALPGHTEYITCVAVHPNGRWIASGGRDGAIRLWDLDSGVELVTLEVADAGHVEGLAFSPDGKVVAGAYRGMRAVLWYLADDGRSAVPTGLFGHLDGVNAVAFTPDGGRLASGSYDQSIGVWEVNIPGLHRKLKGHERSVFSIAVSPDGRWIASGGEDSTVRLWSGALEEWPPRRSMHDNWVTCVAFSNDSRVFVSGSRDNTLKLWDASRNQIRQYHGHTAEVTGVAWGTDRSWFVSSSADRTVRIWETESGSTRRTLNGHDGAVRCVAACGAIICSGGDDATIRVWDADTGEQQRVLRGHDSAVRCLAVSPDGNQVVSGGDDQTVRIWKMSTGQLMRTLAGHTGTVTGVAWNPDGATVVSGSHDRTLRLWNARSGSLRREFLGHLAEVQSVNFSPDGRRIVSGGHHDEIKLWDPELGIATLTLKELRQDVTVVRFSPDGRQLLAGGADHMIEVYTALRSASR